MIVRLIILLAILFWYGSLLVLHDNVPIESIITVLSMLVFCLTNTAAITRQRKSHHNQLRIIWLTC